MRASTAIVLAISSFAAAQNLAGQPACASACLSSAITAGGCALTDAACQCGTAQAAIGTIAAPCLLSACTAVTDLVAAQSAGAAACAAYSAMSTAPMAAAATTTSAVATTSSTVTQTNVATTTMTNAASVAAMSSMSAAMGAAMSSLTAAPVVSSVAAMSSMSAALAGAMSSVAGNVTRATTSAPAMATTNAAVGKMVNGGLIAAALGAIALL